MPSDNSVMVALRELSTLEVERCAAERAQQRGRALEEFRERLECEAAQRVQRELARHKAELAAEASAREAVLVGREADAAARARALEVELQITRATLVALETRATEFEPPRRPAGPWRGLALGCLALLCAATAVGVAQRAQLIELGQRVARIEIPAMSALPAPAAERAHAASSMAAPPARADEPGGRSAAAAPVPRPATVHGQRPAGRGKTPPRAERDVLGDLDSCGDDPTCGL